jgi:hypothetical protein
MRYPFAFFPLFLAPEGDASGAGAAGTGTVADPAAQEPPETSLQAPELTPVQKALAEAKAAAASGEIAFEPGAKGPDDDEEAAGEKPPSPNADGTPSKDSPAGAAGAEAEAGKDGAAADAAADGDDPLLTIELPTRNKGEVPVAIKVPDKETAEALRQLKNGFLRGEEVRAQRREVETERAELAYFQELAQVDPIGLVLEHLDPARHQELVTHLLGTPGVVEKVVEYLQKWDGNPDAQRADLAVMERDREKQKGTIKEALEMKARARDVGRYIGDKVGVLADLVHPDLQAAFRDDALAEVQAHYNANRLRGKLPADQFPVVLERRLRLYGIDKAKALAALTDQPATPPASERARPTGPDAEALAASAKGKTADGQKLIQAAKVRRDVVAAVPGTGAGVSTPRITPPKGQGFMERLKWARANLAPAQPQ